MLVQLKILKTKQTKKSPLLLPSHPTGLPWHHHRSCPAAGHALARSGAGELRQELTPMRASSAAPLWSPRRCRADPPIARAGGEIGAGEAGQAALVAREGARREASSVGAAGARGSA
jgi:hypothetical protein